MSLLFPNRCMFCGKIIADNIEVCRECLVKMPFIKGTRCERCGLEITECSCKIGDFAFDRNIALYHYDNGVKTIIKRFKFNQLPQLSVYMGYLMSTLVKRFYNGIDFDCITYVPMAPTKRTNRGYNQSELLAKHISKRCEIPLKSLLIKKPQLKSQKYRSGKDRRKSVRDKFISIGEMNYKNVLLIDDVMTTGSTISECALMLKRAGVEHVYCATFAITCKK